jgi:hypothetical protein
MWFDANPAGVISDASRRMSAGAEAWGRQTFASNFARGGMSSVIFGQTAKERFKRGMGRPLKYGSSQHISNLEKIQAQHPKDLNIKKAMQKAKSGKSIMKLGGRLAGGALSVGFAAMPLFTTPGGISEKARAVGGGIAGMVGIAVGAKVGMATGAAIGGAIGATVGSIVPGVGTAIGGIIGAGIGTAVGWVAGGFVGSELFEGAYHAALAIPDRMVDRERARRNLNWKNDTAAFTTQSAHTMRQQSLQAMNRGMMSSRSMLGREGVMLHQ